jgi:superfamily II DNA or RNA helicase
MQELCDKVWDNPKFHESVRRVESAWLARELGTEPVPVEPTEGGRLMRAAAILACSGSQPHRRAAFRAATFTYELLGADDLPFDQALRVVLTRLGNLPSLATRQQVYQALQRLPLSLATEEIASADGCAITVNGHRLYLTDFQRHLWSQLVDKRRVALAAPTSAGKSFVLQAYILSLFETVEARTIVYIVPTRALIAQVGDGLVAQFSGFSGNAPDIVTVPIDAETALPSRAVYVMTQERVQLTLTSQPNLAADVLMVDEAHSIADGSRGVLLQWVIDDLLERSPKMQILFASPTVRNLDIFGRLFGLTDVVVCESADPTVAQNFINVTVVSAPKGRIALQTTGDGSQPPTEIATIQLDQTTASRVDKLVHISHALGRGQPSMIYANGAAEAEKIAMQLADLMAEHEPSRAQIALAELASEAVHQSYVLAECVKRGVAFHYSNIPTLLRRAVERAVSQGEITYLVCTSTLLQGVNLPAKNIFIFAPEKGRLRPIRSADFWNLAGRAGRLLREFCGNIFLIDYSTWKSQPLEGPRNTDIASAIESDVKQRDVELINVIRDVPNPATSNTSDLEATFVRLYTHMISHNLPSAFGRAGLAPDSEVAVAIRVALEEASTKVNLPLNVLRRTPNVSVHKQQRLYDRIADQVNRGQAQARSMIPRHPREPEAYESYSKVLKHCHQIILGIEDKSHSFHALIALWWIQGRSLPQIIQNQIERHPKTNTRITIRNTLELVEYSIRFQAVRMFGCYNVLLVHALELAGLHDLVSSIPALPLFLEVGACDKTMISFISLGLSRVTATKLNDISARKDLNPEEAKHWLQTRRPETLGLSPLLLAEVQAVIG